MKRRKKLTTKEALEAVRLATRVAREWDEKRVLRALKMFIACEPEYAGPWERRANKRGKVKEKP